MKIAITFGDKSFKKTFAPVLETLLAAYNTTGNLPTEKKELCNIINHLSFGHFLIFQPDALRPTTEKYLKIEPYQVLVNHEVDKYIEECQGWDNHDTFVLDTDLDHTNNEPVYSF